jgi:hypothetical protein
MKRLNWRVILAIGLIIASAIVYYIHFLIFRDVHHIFIYLVGDIAFVFFEVLMVTLIIHELLSMREKRSMLKKLNMVIGAFFTEVGTDLLKIFLTFDPHPDEMREKLIVTNRWTDKHFQETLRKLNEHKFNVKSQDGDLKRLKEFLMVKKDFLLRLLENPNLLEHETFTDVLWAITHLAEELEHRTEFDNLPATDYNHISGDINRAYERLVKEWLEYMNHLKDKYPYLFSLALRTNPFDEEAKVFVMD